VLIAAVALTGAAAGCAGATGQRAAAQAAAPAAAVSPSANIAAGIAVAPGARPLRPRAASTTVASTAAVAGAAARASGPVATVARAPSGPVPAVVVAVARTSGGSGEVQVDWTAVAGATGYRVLRTDSAGRQARVVADFNITTGRTTAAPAVVNIWSAEHSYLPDRGPLTQVDRSPWFQYIDVGVGLRCYRVLAYNRAGHGPPSAVTCAAPPGG